MVGLCTVCPPRHAYSVSVTFFGRSRLVRHTEFHYAVCWVNKRFYRLTDLAKRDGIPPKIVAVLGIAPLTLRHIPFLVRAIIACCPVSEFC